MIEANIGALRTAVSASAASHRKIDGLLKKFQQASAFVVLDASQKTTVLARLTALKSGSDDAFGTIQDIIDATEPIEE